MRMPTVQEIKKRIEPLRRGDELTVIAYQNGTASAKWNIYVEASRAVWPPGKVRGRRQRSWFIGTARSEETAARTVTKITKKLERARDRRSAE